MKDDKFIQGWGEVEVDNTGRNYRWASKNCILNVKNTNNRNIYILIGSEKEKNVSVYYTDVPEFNIIVHYFSIRPGWHYYKIPACLHEVLKNNDPDNIFFNVIRFQCTDYICEKRETIHELAFQVSEVVLEKDFEYNKYKPGKLKSKYIDIIYVLHQRYTSTITIKTKNRIEKLEIFPGGERSISYEIHEDDYSDDFEMSLYCRDYIELKSIINRENYYDFLGLEQLQDEESQTNLNHSILTAMTIPISIQWFVTWKCNMKCGYCWQESAKTIYRKLKTRFDIPIEKWAERINEIAPRKIYFTGGEPSLFKGLPKLVNLINEYTRFDLTSNFGRTFILDEWKDVDFSRWDYIAFSIHPTQWNSPDLFFQKLEDFFKLKNVDKSKIGIEMVLHPDNIKLVDPQAIIDFSHKHNLIAPHLDPFVDSNVPKFTPSVIRDENELTFTDVSDKFISTDTQTEKGRTPLYCAAGMRRINIDSDGNVFTCMSAIDRSKLFDYSAMPHYQPISNIFDDDFKLNDRPILCWESYRCSACDYDTLDVTWFPFKKNFNKKLPLVE